MKYFTAILLFGSLLLSLNCSAQTSAEKEKIKSESIAPSPQVKDKVNTQITLLPANTTVEELKQKYKAPMRADYKSEEEYSKAKSLWIRKNQANYKKILDQAHAPPR